MTRREHVDVPAPAVGGSGTVIVHGHYGRPFLVFPQRAGPGLGLREQRHGRRGPAVAGRGPLQALLRHLARRRVLVQPCAVDRGPGPPARRVRAVDRRLGAAVHLGRLRRLAGGRHDRRLDGGVPRADVRAAPRRPVPALDQPVRQLRPGVLARLGRAGRGGLLRQPGAVRAGAQRRPPGVAAVPAVGAAGRGPGHVGGHHGLAGVHPRMAGLLREKGIPPSWTSGATTSRTTGRPGNDSSPTISPGSARRPRDPRRPHRAPHRPAAGHRGGLAARVRGAGPPARRGPAPRRHPAHAAHRADHDRAVRPARDPALRPGDRPPGVLVLPPARVAEEDRADGRRVPAEQPVHVPVDGEARGLLRDAAARAQGARHLAGAAEGPAGQRALGVHVVEVQPVLRPGGDRRAGRATRCS